MNPISVGSGRVGRHTGGMSVEVHVHCAVRHHPAPCGTAALAGVHPLNTMFSLVNRLVDYWLRRSGRRRAVDRGTRSRGPSPGGFQEGPAGGCFPRARAPGDRLRRISSEPWRASGSPRTRHSSRRPWRRGGRRRQSIGHPRRNGLPPPSVTTSRWWLLSRDGGHQSDVLCAVSRNRRLRLLAAVAPTGATV